MKPNLLIAVGQKKQTPNTYNHLLLMDIRTRVLCLLFCERGEAAEWDDGKHSMDHITHLAENLCVMMQHFPEKFRV